MEKKKSPYICHLFICTKNRSGARKSCADGHSTALKPILKAAINERGLKGRVRVCESSCFGLCESGPNLIIYPQQILFSGVTENDVPTILEEVERLAEG